MKKFYLFILLITFIVSIGAISAEDVSMDDSTVADIQSVDEDVSVSEVVDVPEIPESLGDPYEYDIDYGADGVNSDNYNITKLQSYVSDTSNAGKTINFSPGTYYGFTLSSLANNLSFIGNSSTLSGNGTHTLFILSNTNGITISGFNLNINSTSAKAINGSIVDNCIIRDNNIFNGSDGININNYYTNVSIINNTFSSISRDDISLVNHNESVNSYATSIIANNTIVGVNGTGNSSDYGIFIGGNFFGEISGNNITDTGVGMQFTGKRNPTNGILRVDILNNVITNVVVGIEMNHPGVESLYIINNTITPNSSEGYFINTNSYFNKTVGGYIDIEDNTFSGNYTSELYNLTDYSYGNTVFPNKE